MLYCVINAQRFRFFLINWIDRNRKGLRKENVEVKGKGNGKRKDIRKGKERKGVNVQRKEFKGNE